MSLRQDLRARPNYSFKPTPSARLNSGVRAVIIRATWWVLAAASAVIATYLLYLATHYAISAHWEAVAAIALLGFWGGVFWLPLLALTGWRWQSLSKTKKYFGLGLPLMLFFTTLLAFVAAP